MQMNINLFCVEELIIDGRLTRQIQFIRIITNWPKYIFFLISETTYFVES